MQAGREKPLTPVCGEMVLGKERPSEGCIFNALLQRFGSSIRTRLIYPARAKAPVSMEDSLNNKSGKRVIV